MTDDGRAPGRPPPRSPTGGWRGGAGRPRRRGRARRRGPAWRTTCSCRSATGWPAWSPRWCRRPARCERMAGDGRGTEAVRARRAAAAPALPAGRDRARLLRRRGQHPHQPGHAGAAARLRHAGRRLDGRRRWRRSASTRPPALVYVDKGLGAAILRAGVRLWDQRPSVAGGRDQADPPQPVLPDRAAARDRPPGRATSPAGTPSWPTRCTTRWRRDRREVAELWRSWAGELAADVHAFAQAGWAPVFALANVVDGPTAARSSASGSATRTRSPGSGCCSTWRCAAAGSAPAPGTTWPRPGRPATRRTRPAGEAGRVARVSLDGPRRHRRGLHPPADARLPAARRWPRVLDPRRVAPGRAGRAGAAGRRLAAHLVVPAPPRRRCRILALLATRAVTDSAGAAAHRARLRAWVADLGADAPARRPDRPRLTAPTRRQPCQPSEAVPTVTQGADQHGDHPGTQLVRLTESRSRSPGWPTASRRPTVPSARTRRRTPSSAASSASPSATGPWAR